MPIRTHVIYQMAPFPMTLSDPEFKVTELL